MEITGIRDPIVVVSPGQPVDHQQVKDQRELIQAVKAVNAASLFGNDNELTFIFDRSSRRAVVRIVNKETGEVVRQIPSETVLRFAQNIGE